MTPTLQGISALLTDAGFELGVDAGKFGPGDVDGYAVFQELPGVVFVDWWGPEAKLSEMFSRYTEVIKAAGYAVRRTEDGTELVVTTKEVGQ